MNIYFTKACYLAVHSLFKSVLYAALYGNAKALPQIGDAIEMYQMGGEL